MSVERIGSVTETVTVVVKTRTSPVNQRVHHKENAADVVSISGGSGTDNITKTHWAPLLPIGDTQSIHKISK